MNYSNGWIIRGGQKYFTTHHEKGARNKNREAQKSSEVGSTNEPKREGRASVPGEPGARSSWFDDATKEIW